MTRLVVVVFELFVTNLLLYCLSTNKKKQKTKKLLVS